MASIVFFFSNILLMLETINADRDGCLGWELVPSRNERTGEMTSYTMAEARKYARSATRKLGIDYTNSIPATALTENGTSEVTAN